MLNKVLFVSFKFMNQILILYVNFYYKVKYRELAQSDIRTAIYKFLHKIVFYWRRYTSLNMHVSVVKQDAATYKRCELHPSRNLYLYLLSAT